MSLLSAPGSDEYYMGLALAEAAKETEADDVPIGCVIVDRGRIVGRARNQVELLGDATAHAEMIALTQAAAARGDWRLDGVSLYVTKEPCPMCAGAMLKSRVSRVVFGAWAPRDGAAGTVIDLLNHPGLGSEIEVLGGIREPECRHLLQEFFRRLRRPDPDE